MNYRCGAFLLVLLTSLTCRADPSAAIQDCGTCHGANGIAIKPGTPHLNGQLPAFLRDAMNAYANGSRPTAIEQHKAFPVAEVDSMAQFFSSQNGAARPKQETDPAIVAKGEKIYGNRCADCHIDGGRDSDKDAPLLAGQDKKFLAEQTLLFKSGGRKFPFMMDDSYRGMSDGDLAAVAEFFASQEQFAPTTKKAKRSKRQ